jgi:hypothetical protein
VRHKTFHASATRIADLETRPYDCERIPREQWEAGDYVVGEVTIAPGGMSRLELNSGRLVHAVDGDTLVGALGIRHATLEVVGSYERIGADGRMHVLTAAGLLGMATSVSGILPPLIHVDYLGHAVRSGKKLSMNDFARKAAKEQTSFQVPTILIFGTSMSAGKTTAAKIIIRELKKAGKRVVGVKLTGAGRYRDILGMQDAGADAIFDFVDVGISSSVLPVDEYRPRLRALLDLVTEAEPEVVVAEAGASPLEPYNGEAAIEALKEAVRLKVLCASDPYAVVGVMQGFGMHPDLVAGLATSTAAGVQVVQKLSRTPALNLLDPKSWPRLNQILENSLS